MERALRIDKKLLGNDHQNSKSALSRVPQSDSVPEQGWLGVGGSPQAGSANPAAPLTRSVLASPNRSVSRDLVNIAQIYKAQKKYDQCIDLYKTSIEINKKNLGPDHPECKPIAVKLLSTLDQPTWKGCKWAGGDTIRSMKLDALPCFRCQATQLFCSYAHQTSCQKPEQLGHHLLPPAEIQ